MARAKDIATKKISSIIEKVSPLLVHLSSSSIKIELSRNFLLFDFMRTIVRSIEDDPYLQFVNELKYHKILGKLLHGTIHEFYRDRNKTYFEFFFDEREVYRLVKQDIERAYKKNSRLKLTISKQGVIIYDNYKKDKFNILLLTIHSGTWVPSYVRKKQTLSQKRRRVEEDIDVHRIYSPLVIEKSGIWIDSKLSRFACDYNRSPTRAIYNNESEPWVKQLWKRELTKKERKKLLDGYYEFYLTLEQLIDSYRFNIIFDGHSMRDANNRADISFGTQHIPRFYMPVVRSMRDYMSRLGYDRAELDKPYQGGYILKWLNKRFPDIFICSMEVNKKLYTSEGELESIDSRLDKLSRDIVQICNIE